MRRSGIALALEAFAVFAAVLATSPAAGQTDAIRVDPSGNVGIGTASPATLLHISSAAAANTEMRVENTNVSAQFTGLRLKNVGGEWNCRVQKTDDTLVCTEAGSGTNELSIYSGGGGQFTGLSADPLLHVAADGKVGIGTATPTLDGDGLHLLGTGNKTLRVETSGNPQVVLEKTGGVEFVMKLTAAGDFALNKSGAANLFVVESGGTTTALTLESTGQLGMNVSAAGPSTVANRGHIYTKDVAASAEVFVQDEAGNATQISPHDPETGEWVFYSENVKTGRRVRINMERMIRRLEELTGEVFIEESFAGEVHAQN